LDKNVKRIPHFFLALELAHTTHPPKIPGTLPSSFVVFLLCEWQI
jgi:hypothetical protein